MADIKCMASLTNTSDDAEAWVIEINTACRSDH